MAIVSIYGEPTLGNVVSILGVVPPVDPVLNRSLVIESTAVQTQLQPFIDRDYLPSLQAMTGLSFSVTNASSVHGVIRVRVDPTLPHQAYRITASLSTDTLIEGGGWRGCKHGIYSWLKLHGCRRLAMGPAFLIRPAKSDLRLVVSVEKTPIMKTFAWGWQGTISGEHWPFGSGDPADYLYHRYQKIEFLDWNCRPRAHYGSTLASDHELVLGVQYDAGFRGNNLTELNTDALYAAQEGHTYHNSYAYLGGDKIAANGNTYQALAAGTSSSTGTGPSGTGSGTDGTVPWTYIAAGTRNGLNRASFHSTYQKLIDLYTLDVVGRYDSNAAITVPDFDDLKLSLGAGFSDGADPCNDDPCVDLLRNNLHGTGAINADARPMDKSLYRNWKIWQQAQLTKPGDWTITDFAYDLQVRPPTPGYPVMPGFVIQLSNWGFTAGEAQPQSSRVKTWGDRSILDGFQLGAYEFWAIPQYGMSDARFPCATAWRRFRDMLNNNLTTFQSESVFSVGAVGISYHGALDMIWNGPGRSDAQLMDDFCSTSFGAGASAMRKTLDRWFLQEFPVMASSPYEFAVDFDNFAAADVAATGDEGSRNRIAVFMAYLVFLHYKHNFDVLAASSPSTATADALAGPFLTHIWRAHLHVMEDAIWTHDNVLLSGVCSGAFVTKWTIEVGDLAPASYPAWRALNGITDYTYQDMRDVFATIHATYTSPTPAVFTPANYLSLIAPYSTTDATTKDSAYMYGGYGPDVGITLEFEVKAGNSDAIELGFSAPVYFASDRLTLTNATTGAVVSDIELATAFTATNDGTIYTINLAIMTPGFYHLRIEQQVPACGWRVRACPRRVPLMVTSTLNRQLFADATFDGWPASLTGLCGYFWVPRNKTNFYFYSAGLGTLAGTAFQILGPSKTVVTPTSLGGDVYRYTVSAGNDHNVWRLDTNGIAGATPKLLDLDNRFAPTKAQMIIATNQWLE